MCVCMCVCVCGCVGVARAVSFLGVAWLESSIVSVLGCCRVSEFPVGGS